MTLLIILRFIYEYYFRFPHFRILRACMHKWISSNPDQIITYQIEILTKKSSKELVFEELWINEKKYNFQLTRAEMKSVWNFTKKEILKLNILSEVRSDKPFVNPSTSSKGILLLGYSYRNKKKYISVKKFKDFEYLRISGLNKYSYLP